MGITKVGRRRPSVATLAMYFDDQSGSDELVIPEDLSTLSDEDLAALATQAREAFDAARTVRTAKPTFRLTIKSEDAR